MTALDQAPTTPSSEQEQSTIARVPAMVERVRAEYRTGRTRTIEWRREQIDGLIRLLDREERVLLDALAADMGKPRLEAWGTEIGVTMRDLRGIRRNLHRWARPRRSRLALSSRPGRGFTIPEPLGVALVMAPWNYPVQLVVQPLAAALAAGNAAVVKPSELVPATSSELARLIPRYVDPEAVAVVEGGAPVATALLAERFDHVFFTGSTRVGRIVMEAAARHLTPVTLELGGKCPVVIDPTANISVAARRIAWGKWLNAGQTCIAPDYVLVTDQQRDHLVQRISDAWAGFAVTDARQSPDYTRIVNEHHTRRIESLLREDHGGAMVVGGEVHVPARYVEPTVVIDPRPESRLMTEEIFGPVLVVVTVESMDAAIQMINDRPRPLALYVFADDTASADAIVHSTSSGGAVVNHVLVHKTPALPFGGVGQSGMGRYHGRFGFDAASNLRAVMTKPSKPDSSIVYPPYSRLKEQIVRRLL